MLTNSWDSVTNQWRLHRILNNFIPLGHFPPNRQVGTCCRFLDRPFAFPEYLLLCLQMLLMWKLSLLHTSEPLKWLVVLPQRTACLQTHNEQYARRQFHGRNHASRATLRSSKKKRRPQSKFEIKESPICV